MAMSAHTPVPQSAPLMLGVSGCRGVVGASLTPTVVIEFAGSFGSWLVERHAARGVSGRRPRIVLAADGRAGFRAVHAAAIAGLLAAGCDVVDLGVCMTPTAGVMVDHLGADAGVVLTASHNPQNWNGLKFLLAGGTGQNAAGAAAPDAATADSIIARYRAGGASRPAPWDRVGHLTTDETGSAVHVGLVLRALDALVEGVRPTVTDRIRAARFTVVLDSVNGAGRSPGRLLLERLGCRVIALGDEPGGVFWHTPEPTRENLRAVSQRVASAGAVIGFCQDPDADRLALLAGDGSYIGEEYTLALATRAVLEAAGWAGSGWAGSPSRLLGAALSKAPENGANGGNGTEFRPVAGSENRPTTNRPTLAANLSTSRMIDDIASDAGARVVRTAVGEANVVTAMKRERSPIGGEGNGGVIWPAVTYVRDSLGSMGLVLALMATTAKSVQELCAQVPTYAIEKRKVDLASKDAARPAVDAIGRHFTTGPAHRPGTRIDTQDGVRVDLPLADGPAWVHVRASNTEPIMRLIAEARSAASARALLDEATQAIDAAR